ncbi:hypothetical protein [Roseobacter sp. CCS2]|uniref:hypothetical protein n=1 Tax=Roseobacter sp. CCS2 TaxID=391593 RepID=UPI0000F3E481|nr:hypothetical protein [Roseobacter sp. CCS2]EBA12645.1 hypothetical protein RCCS2_15149 [Roseobacter sp. CCS2]
MKFFRELCREIIQSTQAESGPSLGCYCVGTATFNLYEAEPTLAPAVAEHFPVAKPNAETANVYLRYDGAFMAQVVDALDGRWFQQIEQLFQDCGLYGYLNTETEQFEFFDPSSRTAIRILPSVEHIPIWERSSPISVIAGWLNQAHGNVMLHSGTLEIDGTGAILCGPSGSGKSLLTLAGIRTGMRSVGDDYIIAEKIAGSDCYQAYPFSRMAKQSPAGLKYLWREDPLARQRPLNWQGKVVFPLGVTYDAPLSVNCVISPFIGKTARLEPTNARDTARKLAESTIYQLPGSPRQILQFASQMVRDLPVYQFEMGPDVTANAQILFAFLKDEFK